MLVGMDFVTEFVESIIATGRLKRRDPLSAILIAHPEMGKTSIVTQKTCKNVQSFTDVTGKGLIAIVQMRPELTHIVLNDLVAIMSHRETVNKYTQAMITAITEEGLQSIADPTGITTYASGKRGIIACTTLDLSRDGRTWWKKTGLSSRMIPFAYEHSAELMIQIKDIIDGDEQEKIKPGEYRLPPKLIEVQLAEKYTKQIRTLADRKSRELGETGYRRLKQFRSLAMGHALRRSRKRPAVNQEEIDFLIRLFPYVSYTTVNPL